MMLAYAMAVAQGVFFDGGAVRQGTETAALAGQRRGLGGEGGDHQRQSYRACKSLYFHLFYLLLLLL
jgi:hypothetical protein